MTPPAGPMRWPVTAAAVVTVLAVVGLDVLDGATALHVMTLGVVAALVSALRVRLRGQHRGLFVTASVALAAQPTLHLTGEVAHTAGSPVDLGHGWLTSTALGTTHVLLAVITIVSVGIAEWLLTAMATAWSRALSWVLRWLPRLVTRIAPAPCTVPLGPDPTTPEPRVAAATRRGPPVAVPSAG